MAKAVRLKEISELGIEEANLLHIQESYLRQVSHSIPVTAKKKNKSEVQATGAKWYRQKGTGRARQGETTNPHLTGGGLAFPPKPRQRLKSLNKQVRRSALRSAVLLHLVSESAFVIQGQDFNEIAKTKEVAAILGKISAFEPICLVTGKDAPVRRSAGNIWNVRVISAAALNVRELVECGHLVFTQEALDEFKALLSASNSGAAQSSEAAPAEAEETTAGGEE